MEGHPDHFFLATYLAKHKLAPVNGYIELPDRPGLGLVLDESRIETRVNIEF